MTAAQYFWLIAGVALLCQLFANNLLGSRVGRTLLALRGSEIAAQSVGVNVYRWKVLAFVISSVYAGLGGVFFAHQNGFINSDTFVFALSVLVPHFRADGRQRHALRPARGERDPESDSHGVRPSARVPPLHLRRNHPGDDHLPARRDRGQPAQASACCGAGAGRRRRSSRTRVRCVFARAQR